MTADSGLIAAWVKEVETMGKIAILGWGSLIWDKRPEFDRYITGWTDGGPELPIEFCRKSKSRGLALTLVIDRSIGTPVETLYALTTRTDPRDTMCDLRSREGTTLRNIGFVDLKNQEEHGRDPESLEAIRVWAKEKNISFVTWTDLESSFDVRVFEKFTEGAMRHLKSLNAHGLREAVKYIVRTPAQTDTRLRKVLMDDAWFREQMAKYHETV